MIDSRPYVPQHASSFILEQTRRMGDKAQAFIATLQLMGFTSKGKTGFAYLLIKHPEDSNIQEIIHISNANGLVTYYYRAVEIGTDMEFKEALELINDRYSNQNGLLRKR